ncbi:MAG: phosphoribosylformylglycinamidine synthase subunit PurQ [Chloroflexota bacterium]|nr:phosphoribosylformylglycinamidine synthase subunit PurQ [Chloroflexota bacterium]
MSRGVAVITFPGSNGDRDAFDAFATDLGVPTEMVDYRETNLDGFEAVVLPGGFSYGDYLRSGAIARFAPIIEPLREFARRGGPVLGICNGFQVLTEAHLLPGALLMNRTLQFQSMWVPIRVESGETAWTGNLTEGEVLTMPVANGWGNYFADPETVERLEGDGRVVFRFVDEAGEQSERANINGSVNNIAGITNEGRNVVGLMPHPERAADPLLGPADGKRLIESVQSFLASTV